MSFSCKACIKKKKKKRKEYKSPIENTHVHKPWTLFYKKYSHTKDFIYFALLSLITLIKLLLYNHFTKK